MGPPVPSSVEMCVQQISFKNSPPRYQLKFYEQTNALLFIYIPNDRLDFKTRHFVINKSAVSQIAAATLTSPIHLLICKQCPEAGQQNSAGKLLLVPTRGYLIMLQNCRGIVEEYNNRARKRNKEKYC